MASQVSVVKDVMMGQGLSLDMVTSKLAEALGWKPEGTSKWFISRVYEPKCRQFTEVRKSEWDKIREVVGLSESDMAQIRAMVSYIKGCKKSSVEKLSEEDLDKIYQDAYNQRVDLAAKAKAINDEKDAKRLQKAKAKEALADEAKAIEDELMSLLQEADPHGSVPSEESLI